MALTAFPTLTFNSSTGSDSLASGAGPATAITCLVNGATTNSTTIVVDTASADLDTIAEDGSAVLFVTGIGFVRIDTVDNATLTIVVETALTIGDNVQLAIGGKRATLDETESRRLFAATSSPTASGASGQWTIQAEDDGALSLSSTLTMAFTAGTGFLTIKGDSASSRRTSTQSGNAVHFTANTTNRTRLENIVFRNSNGTKNYVFSRTGNSPLLEIRNCVCGASDGTNCPNGIVTGTCDVVMYDTAVIRCGSNGVASGGVTVQLYGCEVSRCSGIGVTNANSSSCLRLENCIVSHNTGDGITKTGGQLALIGNTISNNGGDGVELTTNNVVSVGGQNATTVIINNQFTNNTAYGLNLSGTTPHFPICEYNNFNGNGTDAANGLTLPSSNTTIDPGYTDTTNSVRNYAVGTAAKATGFPAATATVGAGQSGTTTYVEIGAAQRQEVAGGLITHPGMAGGCNG